MDRGIAQLLDDELAVAEKTTCMVTQLLNLHGIDPT